MMFEGKHIHYSPVDNKPLCSYSVKVCKQRRLKDYAFCIRHILEDKSAPFRQCSHFARYNHQKCTNPIPSNEDRKFCNSHMQVAGFLPKKERKIKREKDKEMAQNDGKLKFADRLKALLKKENNLICDDEEDPYAFTDPVSENGSLRTPWNCLLKTPESLDTKPEPPTKMNNISLSENKASKSHGAPKLSKTMNRLQAKIAENKLLDKLKKSQESSHLSSSPSTPPPSKISKSGTSSPLSSTLSPGKAARLLSESEPSSPLVSSSSSVSPRQPCSSATSSPQPSSSLYPRKILRRLHTLWSNSEHMQPRESSSRFGEDSSDSDSEEDPTQLYHQYWSSIWDNKIMRGLHTNIYDCRTSQQCHLQKELQRHLAQLRQVNHTHQRRLENRSPLVQALVEAARWNPGATARLLLRRLKGPSLLPKSSPPKSLGLETCCYKAECSTSCTHPVLPYTRHCKKHIMYNVDQLLFEHCTAKFPDNTQCCSPAFDIQHALPLCPLHAKRQAPLGTQPKPKKPRKRPKPSALTRPPKRGKKKKKPSQVRPLSPTSLPPLSSESNPPAPSSLPSSAADQQPLAPPPQQVAAVPPPVASVVEPTPPPLAVSTVPEEALEPQFSPEMELPIDTAELANQASKLLEEHDFTEVLNKIPDYAFTDLFTEARNGEYVPSREETEELERALAAVSKDVNMAKESLAKMSVNSQDLEELDSNLLGDFSDLPHDLLATDPHHLLNGFYLDGGVATTAGPSSFVFDPQQPYASTPDCHWMLNPSSEVLAQLAYHQNGAGNGSGILFGPPPKYADVLNSASLESPALQQTPSSTKVIAQEGAS